MVACQVLSCLDKLANCPAAVPTVAQSQLTNVQSLCFKVMCGTIAPFQAYAWPSPAVSLNPNPNGSIAPS